MGRNLLELANQLELLATKEIVNPSDISFIYQYADDHDSLIVKAYDQVFHFLADADIRNKDAKYASWQKSQLINLASELRQRGRMGGA